MHSSTTLLGTTVPTVQISNHMAEFRPVDMDKMLKFKPNTRKPKKGD